MTNKGHVTAAERDQIGVLLASGISQNEIARKLGRSKSSVSYEIKRNSRDGQYQPILANLLSRERNRASRKTNALKDPRVYFHVVEKLRCGWSPEQMAGRWRKRNHNQTVICPETIYRYIYSPEGKKENLREYLNTTVNLTAGVFPTGSILASDPRWLTPGNSSAIGKQT